MLGALAAAAAVLLIASGVAKLRTPGPTATMLTSLRSAVYPPARRRASRAALRVAARFVGVGEIAVGTAFVAGGGRLAAVLLAGCYAAFAVVALVLSRSVAAGRPTACGCFGGTDAPVGAAHVLLDLIAFGAAAGVAVRPVGALGGFADTGTAVAVVGCAQAVLLAWLGYLAITALPALEAARREVGV